MIAGLLVLLAICSIPALMFFIPVFVYIGRGKNLGVDFAFQDVVGMRIRKTMKDEILKAAALAKRENIDVNIIQLETHFLASGRPLKVVEGIVVCKRQGVHVTFNVGATVDLINKPVTDSAIRELFGGKDEGDQLSAR